VNYLMDVLQQGGWPPSPSFLLVAATLLFVLLTLELRDKLSLKGDLEIARKIQFGLLPFEPWQSGSLSALASMQTANTVGGDYFDLIELGEGRMAVVIGDVAGKGMPAALLMALLQGSLRTLVTAGFRGAELIGRLNQHLAANIPRNRLVTLFYAEVDPAGGPLSYVNAGHNPPLIARASPAPASRSASWPRPTSSAWRRASTPATGSCSTPTASSRPRTWATRRMARNGSRGSWSRAASWPPRSWWTTSCPTCSPTRGRCARGTT
jgi:hypothetical protein